MDPRAYSFDGDTTINDNTNFMTIFPDGSISALADGKAGSVERSFFGPVYTYKGRTGRNLVIEVVMLSTLSSQIATLKKRFNTFTNTLQRLIIKDAADSDEQYYLDCTPISFAKKDKATARITLFVPDSAWIQLTANTQNWTVTSSGATQAVTAGGNLESYPVITISPQAMKSTGGGAYRRYYFIRNQMSSTLEDHPVEITNGGLNTGALVADTSRNILINQGGGIDAVVTTIPYDNPTGTIPTAGMVYVDTEQISFTGRTGTTSGDLTGCTRGVNGTSAATHADDAVMYISKMEADGGDIQVLIDGEQSDYWLADMNGADTEIWSVFDFSSGQSMTLGETIAGSGAVDTIQLENTTPNGSAIEALPNRGYLLIGSEAYYYTAKNVTAKRLSGVKRAVLDTSMAGHAISDAIYWIEHTVELRYGNHELPAYTVDDTRKPMFNLSTSTNTSWDYDDYLVTGADSIPVERTARWHIGVLADEGIAITTMGTRYYYESMSTTAPAAQTSAVSKTFSVLGIVEADQGGLVNKFYYFKTLVGFTHVALDGQNYRANTAGSDWWAATADDLLVSNTDGFAAESVAYSLADPGGTSTPTAFSSGAVALGATYTRARIFLARNTSNDDGEVRTEVNNCTWTLDSANTPAFGTSPGEVQVYPLNAQLKNNTSGEYINVSHTLPLADTVEVDTANKTVEHVEEGTSIRGALTKSTLRHTWLALAVGANTLAYTETGVTDVDLVITWPDRNN